MESTEIPFNKPFISGKELYYIADSVMKGTISGNGFYTKRCELLLENLTGIDKVLMTNSCTAALEMACMLIDLKPGDEVIMPSYTFVSTAVVELDFFACQSVTDQGISATKAFDKTAALRFEFK